MRKILPVVLCLLFSVALPGQNTRDASLSQRLNDWKEANSGKTHQELFDDFVARNEKEFADFTRQRALEFARFLNSAWEKYEAFAPIPEPVLVTPVEVAPLPVGTGAPGEAVEVPVDPTVIEQAPVTKHAESYIPQESPAEQNGHSFCLYDTQYFVSLDVEQIPKLKGTSNKELSTVWKKYMESESLYRTQMDCLFWRYNNEMGDWMYLQFLDSLTDSVFGSDRNNAVLLKCFLLVASDLDFRLAKSGNHLCCLLHPDCGVYEYSSYTIRGTKYYLLEKSSLDTLEVMGISNSAKPLDLLDTNPGALAADFTCKRSFVSQKYPDFSAWADINPNLISFAASYPVTFTDSPFTKWIPYARSRVYAEGFYESLRKNLAGKNNYEAVSMLLDLVQTGFAYEDDEKLWGRDRVFFPDETLYYPYSDCEDRAIMFARCVRDIIGLESILVYYPGHLAAAVHFPEGTGGDYFCVGGKRFTVCDPVYIGAPVGVSIKSADPSMAVAIKF